MITREGHYKLDNYYCLRTMSSGVPVYTGRLKYTTMGAWTTLFVEVLLEYRYTIKKQPWWSFKSDEYTYRQRAQWFDESWFTWVPEITEEIVTCETIRKNI